MNVTDGDRERAREIVAALSPESAYVDESVYDGDVAPLHDAIAAALAEERERARAPFLALAERFSGIAEELGWALGEHYADAADAISRAAKETE